MNIFTLLLTQPLTNGLVFIYKYTGQNLGVAILIFSIALIFLLRPLTKPYMESMKKIKALEPQLAKLRKKYSGDKLKMSQVQADLYKQNKVNPAAGCLPYILQFFVLIALFRVFTTVLASDGSAFGKINELLYPVLKLTEGQSLNTRFLYLDISKPDVFHLPGISFAIPGLFLILASVAQFLSVKITTPFVEAEKKVAEKTKSETDDMQVAMQQSMTYTLPLMTLFFGLKFPAGLALYWLIFSLINVYQQVSMSGWGSLTPQVRKLSSLFKR